jgi:capsule polysaccharide export protein KpsE/RkpR
MVDVINVAIGAMLGVILADSPQFKINSLKDMFSLFTFILIIIMFACNIWITTRSMARRRYDITTLSIVAFVAV